MVLAGVLIDEKILKEFKKLDVKDSKMLTSKRREFLASKIKKKADIFEVALAFPKEIDGQNHNGIDLNKVEAIKAAEIINKINKGFKKIKVVIDCPSVGIEKWAKYLMTHIKNPSTLDISCEHKADVNHVAVAAASIIAKSVRESEMAKLKDKFGPQIGSGYCSDPHTCKFLEKYAKKHEKDGLFRKTWSTWKNACANLEQRKLF
ncbi:ribonuclease HII [Candidatus Pacearchaeota archaeon]|nr:ribonuclease HII [Candidatus Pacearchaeota archaeon]